MGLWSYYFFAKLLLYFGQYIDLHVWPNLGFAAFLALPLKRRPLRILRQVIAVPLGIALLYHDSWLPPPARILATGNNLQQFSFGYLVELLGRFIDWRVIGALALTLLVWYLLSRKLRMATFAVLGIAVAPLLESMLGAGAAAPAAVASAATPGQVAAAAPAPEAPLTPDALNQELSTFYQQESLRRVAFPHADDHGGNYDLIYLHICSLAWDDLAYVDERSNPFLSHLDVTLSNFNSAASYSGPAAIRVLRGNCGQPKHAELYDNTAPECYLYNQVQQAGFEPEALLNHDGHFGDFLKDVREHGGFPAPLFDNRQAPVGMRAFDDSPVYDDGELLLQWWKHRLGEAAPRVALYYNTMSLHDGNRLQGQPNPGSARDSYKIRAQRLFTAFQKLADAIQASGRKAIIVMVPEHGAALRGDRMQISGLREIPTPAITLVPVGIKLIGLAAAPADAPQVVTAPGSFLALNQIVANMLADSPFAKPQLNLADYLKDLPQTRHEAENEGTVILRQGSHYMMRTPDGSWSEYKVQ